MITHNANQNKINLITNNIEDEVAEMSRYKVVMVKGGHVLRYNKVILTKLCQQMSTFNSAVQYAFTNNLVEMAIFLRIMLTSYDLRVRDL